MKYLSYVILPLIMVMLLSSCGYSQSHRAVTGGAIGAGVGAVGSAVTGGNPVAGAVVGGVVGAGVGALTSPRTLNLGH